MCDGEFQCSDESDEKNCAGWSCVDGFIKCADQEECVQVCLMDMDLTLLLKLCFICAVQDGFAYRSTRCVRRTGWIAMMDQTSCVMTPVCPTTSMGGSPWKWDSIQKPQKMFTGTLLELILIFTQAVHSDVKTEFHFCRNVLKILEFAFLSFGTVMEK